ncbi:hypothetical protein PV08_07984 [Exophiala spinifera]|uniref:Mid2 domain-containing protein n=1 Tax=Exophiala spinifera TaxID=91928 RepID=A0A0D1ZIV5_9EURO|nr:uncharacterized protein PV08_07984 [Exophiala spinifera]KIW12797.1 hypothetical protein PV08_07984 [Exophiala spinifera]
MFAQSSIHLVLHLVLPAALVLHAMAGFNPDISNGTCYYNSGSEAPSRFIPCGNAAIRHKSCCESSDMCLSSHACYNAQYGVTYLAGCTDPDYEDEACPVKGDFSDQTWAGLVYCNGTSEQWVACEDSGSTVTTPSPCACPSALESRTVAFADASVLNNIMSLPASLQMSVTWKDVAAYASEHALTSVPSAVSASSSSKVSATTLLPPVSASASRTGQSSNVVSSSMMTTTTTTTTTTTNNSTAILFPTNDPKVTNAGLDTGGKIGIALGSAAGAIFLLVLLSFALLRFRRRRQEQKEAEPSTPSANAHANAIDLTRPQSTSANTDLDMRSPAWSGHKSELAADETTSTMSPTPAYSEFTRPRPQSAEVQGSPGRLSTTARPTCDGGFTVPGRKGTYYEMDG